MNNIPCVCIMIPTYNQAAYIQRAIESALAQDYPNLEILVADDHSDDSIDELLAPYILNPKIKYTKNDQNIGRVANYRRALDAATNAEWVINLDGDDYYTNPHFISTAMAAIHTADEKNILFYQGMHTCLHDGREDFLPTNLIEDELELSAADYFLGYFTRLHFSHMSTLYNRKMAIQSDFYRKDILSADIFSFLQLCINNSDKKVILSKTISGVWVKHKNNSSQTIQVKQHLKNMGGYKILYRLAIKKGFNQQRCAKWLMRARYIYLRTFAGTITSKLKS
jgi:glycosyltransferase involved in cell wall biosynthesis